MSSLKIAFFSPMPPSRSGIADYSEALVAELKKRAQVEVFERASQTFDPARFDVNVYHAGNNVHHDFVYETALRYPGVTVMHEANLHHLLADLTIKRNDWAGYVAECEYNGGAAALAFAQRVRALETGPDYEGVPMTRRLLERSRGLIVHSDFMVRQMREQGFTGPVAHIPHGAWIPKTDRNSVRYTLGVDEVAPLVGAFGYIKPYKRIAESLRALRRLVRLDPRVKMILVGEPHPDFPVQQLIRTLGLQEHVRIIGFAPIDRFVDYMGACDIILNLRFPTVGETSGSLLRALGLGKAVMVSDIGAFAEMPDDICLKVPVGDNEENLIFEYLNVLVSRPELASAMGNRARDWVARECSWSVVADRYIAYLEQFRSGAREPQSTFPAKSEFAETAPKLAAARKLGAVLKEDAAQTGLTQEAAEDPKPVPAPPAVDEAYVESWTATDAKQYVGQHISRFVRTLELTPPGDDAKSILEMGAYMQITPSLKHKLGYGYVRGCYYGVLGRVDHKSVTSDSGEVFECDVDHFDAERDSYPYPDAAFDTVLCCELIEHLFGDPMHMMAEINRILKPGGHLVMTTPNIGSMRGLSAMLQGYHPGFFPAYIGPRDNSGEADARHNREYMPMEIHHLFTNSGFEVTRLETGEFLDQPHPELGWIEHLLDRYSLSRDMRGDGIYAVGRKTGAIKERWPEWLYS